MKIYDKTTASLYLAFLDVNILYGWAMSQKLPENGFKQVGDLFQFKENFLKKL